MTITSPKELAEKFDNKRLLVEYAQFGIIPAFWKEQGVLYYNSSENDGCSPITYISLIDKKNEYPIIVSHRGNCSFVTKARHAQIIGAQMLLIINDIPGSVPGTLITNDGTGDDITIPSVMISKEDGDVIIAYMSLHHDSKVILNIDYLTQASHKASFHYFFSSSDFNSYLFLDSIVNIFYEDFKEKVDFIPTYVILRSPFYNEKNPRRAEHCLCNGLYCYYPEDLSKVSDGQQIVLEDLRQICLYNIIGDKEKYKGSGMMLYFTYLNSFFKSCIDIPYPRINELCSYETMKRLSIETSEIDDCMTRDFNVDKKSNAMYINKSLLLTKEYDTIKSNGINMFPTIFINEKPLLGTITIEKIINALCNAIIDKSRICQSEVKKMTTTQGINRKFIIGITVSIALINLLIFFLCRRYLKKRLLERMNNNDLEIESRINQLVGTYFALKDVN